MKVVDCVQGDGTWIQSRLGHLTASRISEALTKLKGGGESATRRNLVIDLAVERITGEATDHYVSAPMQRGLLLEPAAIFGYEQRMGVEVERVGFVLHPTIEMAGCSPDGIVGDGIVQAKCPLPRTHATYLLGEVVPSEYIPQCMWELACTGKAWCDFVSYCPDFPEPLDLFICRLERDDTGIAGMEAEAVRFLAEVENTVLRLRGGLEGLLEASVANHESGEFVDSGRLEAQGEALQPLVPRAVIPPLVDMARVFDED